MKRHTTYPTTHPHWIDDDETPSGEKSRFGITFTTAFAIVLALHVAGLGGIYAYSQLKSPKPVASKSELKPGPASDALARNAWPESEAQPKVVATPPPAEKKVAVAKPAPKAPPVVAAKEKAVPVPSKPVVAVAKPRQEAPVVAKAAATPAVRNAEAETLKKAFLAAKGNTPAEPQRAIPAAAQAVAEPEVSTPVAASQKERIVSAPVEVAPVAAAPKPARYTLAPGDNLYMVSRRLQVSYNALMEANNLTDPRQLRVGQTLVVPQG